MYGKQKSDAVTPTRAFNRGKSTMSSNKIDRTKRLSLRATGQPRRSTFLSTPLPVKDLKKAMPENISKICKFMIANDPSHKSIERELRAPSSQFFVMLFEYIYQMIDEDYSFPTPCRNDEEIMGIFKGLQCPVPLKSNHFQPIGSLHGLPYLYEALSWLIDFVQIQKSVLSAPNTIPLFDSFEEKATPPKHDIASEPWFTPMFQEYLEQGNAASSLSDAFWINKKQELRKFYEVTHETERNDALKKKKLEQLRAERQEIENEENENDEIRTEISNVLDDISKAKEFHETTENVKEQILLELEETLKTAESMKVELAMLKSKIDELRQNNEDSFKKHGMTAANVQQLMEENNQDKALEKDIQDELDDLSKKAWCLKESPFDDIKQKFAVLVNKIKTILVETNVAVDLDMKLFSSPKEEKTLQKSMNMLTKEWSSEINRGLQQKKLDLVTEVRQFPSRLDALKDSLQLHHELLDDDKKAMSREERLHRVQREAWKTERQEKESELENLQNEMEVLKVSMQQSGSLEKEIEETEIRLEQVTAELSKKKELVEIAIRKKIEEIMCETAKIEHSNMKFYSECEQLEKNIKTQEAQ